MAPISNLVNMDEIARILRDVHGIPAVVAMTGGGVATIYAGATHTDEDGDERWSVIAGPGRFADPDVGFSVGYLADFYVGPDDATGGDHATDVRDVGATTERSIALLIAKAL